MQAVVGLCLCVSLSSPTCAASTRTTGGNLRVGVVGCGRIGQVHLDTITRCRGVEVVAVADYFRDVAETTAETFGVPNAFTDAADVIEHPAVDAVWICSPSQFHSEQIKQAARAGKHIFCEKPIATDLRDTIEAVSFCKKRGVKLMTALQRRFDPNFARIKV